MSDRTIPLLDHAAIVIGSYSSLAHTAVVQMRISLGFTPSNYNNRIIDPLFFVDGSYQHVTVLSIRKTQRKQVEMKKMTHIV
jgi:hypothetical protein